jgi:hypothetical protein
MAETTDETEKNAPTAGTKAASKRSGKGVNKSAEIRKLAQLKGANVRPVDVVAELKAKGITVAAPQVSMVLKRMGFRRRRRTAVRSARAAARRQLKALGAPRVADPVTVDDLLAARKAAARLGGTDRAIAALMALKKLD